MARERHVSAAVARDFRGDTHQTRTNLRWTGRWDAFALGWQVAVFEDVLYPGGVLEISIGLLEWGDGVIGPQLSPEFGKDCRKWAVRRACSESREMGD